MRLHTVEVTAFGPFAGTERVDFDRLSAAGLFLLHGPTGAGKTSLLDAVCFALYGRVPGARRTAGRLRSDHADPALQPQVRCEFSSSGRRFEVLRSPEWDRPKRRGTGTTRAPAQVLLREWHGGDWTTLSTRLDEVGERIQQVIGLGPEQFTQLILLPQGEFAAFLHAKDDERRAVLQRLFGTERFLQVEGWLAERRRHLQQRLDVDRRTTLRFLARAQEALTAAAAAPPEITPEPLPDPDQPGAIDGPDQAGWARNAAQSLQRWADWSRDRLPDLRRDAEQALEHQQDLEQRRRDLAALVLRRARRAELHRQLAQLEAEQPAHQARQNELVVARAAVVLAAVLEQVAASEQAVQDLALQPGALGPDPSERCAALMSQLGVLTELLPVQAELGQLLTERDQAQRELALATEQRRSGEARLLEQAERIAGLRAQLSAVQSHSPTLPQARESAAHAAQVLAAAELAAQLRTRQQQAADQLRRRIDEHQAALDTSLSLRARRLAGMAAELAATLQPDTPCVVCGATAHPHPAAAAADAVSEQDERAHQQRCTQAQQRRAAAQQELEAVTQQALEAQGQAAGHTPQSAAELLAQAHDALRLAEQAEQTERTCEQLLAELLQQDDVLRAQLQDSDGQLRTRSGTLDRLQLRIEVLQERLRAHGDGEEPDVAAQHEELTALLDTLRDQQRHWLAMQQARDRLLDRTAAAGTAAQAAGFADLTSARAAVRSPAQLTQLEQSVRAHQEALAQVHAALQAPELGCAADAPEPLSTDELSEELSDDQLARLQQQADHAVTQAAQLAQQATARHTLGVRATHALSELAAGLQRHVRAGSALREQYGLLHELSTCVEGTGGDNALRMRLSSYVLAARLAEVAAAASERLAEMTSGRFTLVHHDERVRGGGRSGLGLHVVDAWSGTRREPGSLSGGETFCTALALALGLADVLQAEAGGATVETLLVDEGFGSLDAATLDEVMDVLDALRSGGRAVGLVSHVADLLDRIPTHLQVVKGRNGSHLVAQSTDRPHSRAS